jgi:hypothetical protein
MNYFKILQFLENLDKRQFDVPANEQLEYLHLLGVATTDVCRSYNQYLCQNFFARRIKILVLNFVAIFLVPLYLIFSLLKGLSVKKGEVVEAIAERKNMDEVIPEELVSEFRYDTSKWYSVDGLSVEDFVFIFKKLFKYYFRAPYFVFKCIIKASKYSAMIKAYYPRAIIVFSEYSFTSSLLTNLCEHHNIEHINVMHGEKLFYIRDSYFRFSRCYIWNSHYKKIFIKQMAYPEQFIIAIPRSMCTRPEEHVNKQCYADFKYYLAADTEESFKSIVKSLAAIKQRGYSVKYRIHPRYSDLAMIKKYVSDKEIEYPQQVNILDSISNTEYAIGSYTTVLNQAQLAGKKIVLDDMTYNKIYNQLKSLDYILSSSDHLKLSDFQ